MKKTIKNKTLTPEQYIRQKARTLPIGQCYMNKNWFISGIGIAVVCRRHKMDTYTVGIFQIDTFCTGLVECKIEFSRDKTSYENMINYFINTFKIEPVTYQEVHNLIYGALEFGEEAGFTPPTTFNLAKFILEEDTEDIPLISYQYGKFGKHFLWADSISELDAFMPHLISHLGKENVLFGLVGNDQIFRGEDFYDSRTRQLMYNIASKMNQHKVYPTEPYSYVHPTYPAELKLKHPEVKEILYSQDNYFQLNEEQQQSLLALPHEELKEDLEQIMLYETGQTCDSITEEQYRHANSALIHCMILLGELGYKESLPSVLEVLSQRKPFYDYHFGIILNEISVPAIYLLGKDQLDKLFDFIQTPGLYTFARYLVFPAVVQIVEHEPERREEVIEWFRKVLNFYTENLDKDYCCDGPLIGLITIDLIRIQATELLPELKVLFATGKVDEQCCGNLTTVEKQMSEAKTFSINYHFKASEQYKELKDNYEQLVRSNTEIIEAALAELAKTAAEKEVGEVTEITDETPAAQPADDSLTADAEVVEEVKVEEVKAEEAEEVKAEEAEAKPAEKKKATKKSSETKKTKTTKKTTKSSASKAEKDETAADEVKEKPVKAKKTTAKKTTTAKASPKKSAEKEETPVKEKAEKKAKASKPASKKTTKKVADAE